MPKTSNIQKAKLKLGKGKQAPSNAVDTSFKARSIALPSQSIAHDRPDEAPTTKRKLTLNDLLAHLKHYNTGTRRDAIIGLRELLEAHPELIAPHLTALINSCVRIIGDEDASVRKALLTFLGWLLHRVPADDLNPHAPVLLLFTTSAQTHIFPEIRIDAIRFLDMFLETIPDVVTEGWAQRSAGHGSRVLEGYLGILNAGTAFGEGADTGPVRATSIASVVLSTASKLVVLRSMTSFFSKALSPASSSRMESSTPSLNWFLSASFSSPEAFRAFDTLLLPAHHPTQASSSGQQHSQTWSEEADMDVHLESSLGHFEHVVASLGAGWTLQDLVDIDIQDSKRTSEDSSTKVSFAAHLARTLHSTLISTYLDCAASVFSPSSPPAENEYQMVLAVGGICRTLYGTIFCEPAEDDTVRASAGEDLRQILGYLTPYFPFTLGGSNLVKRDIKAEQAFQDLNLIYCELTSFLVLANPQAPRQQRIKPVRGRRQRFSAQSRADGFSAPLPTVQVSRVSEYVIQTLRGEVPAGASQTSLARPITPTIYLALLPTIWSLLNSPRRLPGESDMSDAVLRVVVEHAIKASSTSVVKKCTVDFLARLVLLDREPEYHGSFSVGLNSEGDKMLTDWILHLPRTLWELGASHLPTSEIILRVLLRLCQRRSPLLREETVSSISARLVPYFIMTHATRGKLSGPYIKLPSASPLRRLVLDVVFSLSSLARADYVLLTAVSELVDGTEMEGYWTSVKSFL
ncbi:uncharacterized protein FIBRA_07361 [Fibroporia radiculosa]|uniref:Pre-rRNA-processing protein n=1 Tax=Fibroporia radiculosa TaxID=599839 RepID=J4I0J8_9APHY|nr:uncharacterized protein FIBRA_07361 [Fibroporia radiculosa]CCM05152.1 predicted protein [Fibroporia radiculosa]